MMVRMSPGANVTEGLFGPGVLVEVVSPLPRDAHLLPEEEGSVRTAGVKRRREFAAGRQCARRALAHLGFAGVPLPASADRAPCWPVGVCGSISHTELFCIA